MQKCVIGTLVAVLAASVVLMAGCGVTTPGSSSVSEPLPTESTETPSATSAVAKVSPSVVQIIAEYGNWHSSGTGIVIDQAGYILTNNHVVEKGYYAMVLLPGKGQVKAEIVYRDQSRDFAILKCPSGDYPAIALGSAKEPNLGEDVIAMGFPSASIIGDSVSISKGVISAFRTIEGMRYIQTDASLNPGSSGGPLINIRGEVIGINTWKLTEAEGISFAIRIDSIKPYVEDVLQRLIDGRISVLGQPSQRASVPTEGVVLKYHGVGSAMTPPFNIVSSSPWKLFIELEWDGTVYIWGSKASEIDPNRSDYMTAYSRVLYTQVTAGRLYETHVYALTGDSIVLGIERVPPDGEWTVWIVDKPVPTASVPFTYEGEGGIFTSPFLMETSTKYKMTFSTSWDGDFGFGFYDTKNKHVFAMGRSTGSWVDFPDSVKTGRTYEWIFDWREPSQVVYLHIEGVPPKGTPPIGKWTISIARTGSVIVSTKPKVDVTVIVEYEGKWHGELKGGSAIDTSDERSLEFRNASVPVEYVARKTDGGANPLVLKLLYSGRVVAQETAGGDDKEARVFWQGPP